MIALVMAAGKGTRMLSERPKVLHGIAGEPMLGFVMNELEELRQEGLIRRVVVIVGHAADQVQAYLRKAWPASEDAIQAPQLGTGHAVMQAAPALVGHAGAVLIVNGDLPLLSATTLRQMAERHRSERAALTLLTVDLPDPGHYGRILRGPDGSVSGIVEYRDATPGQRAISEINVGVYLAEWPPLLEALSHLTPENDQGEFYLTDAVAAIVARRLKVVAVKTDDIEATYGINNRAELAAAGARWRRRTCDRWLERGVTIEDPATTWIGPRTVIGADTVIEPGVQLYGATRIGARCTIGSHSRLVDAVVGDRATIRSSDITDSSVGEDSTVGPFARLRDHVVVGRGARIGNFVEMKKVRFGDGAKAAHLTYLGDAEVGERANIGCGTVTCNYDGERKHRTTIGKGAFVGTNNTLVAPLSVGEDAYTAAGSTLTEDVPAGALALGRARQVIKEGWAYRRTDERARRRAEAGSDAGGAAGPALPAVVETAQDGPRELV